MRRRIVVMGLVLAGCAGGQRTPGEATPAATPDAPVPASQQCVTGRVGTFGPAVPAPRIVLQVDDTRRVALDGDSVGFIGRLTGATVTACGVERQGGSLLVESFELREVDGMQAYLGTLRRVDGETALDPGTGRPPVTLGNVPGRLGDAAGRRAWVAGEWKEGRFAVRSFGILATSGG